MVLYKEDIVRIVAEESGLSKKNISAVIDSFISAISDAISRGDRVQLTGFGSFEAKTRNARMGRNPHTGDEVTIPARKVPAFNPGKTLKNMIS